MKHKLILSSAILISLPMSIAHAQDVTQPYMVTQSITQTPIDKETCLALMTSQSNSPIEEGDDSVENENRVAQIQEQIAQTQLEYEQINQTISSLESDPDHSIAYATYQLETVIDLLYEEAVVSDPNFSQLSEEEQFNIISQNETILEWQAYITEIQQTINHHIATRDQLEASYNQLNYELESIQHQLVQQDETSNQLNQCLLYPYSTEILHPNNILLNQEVVSLNEYLTQIDNYLARIIPIAYQKVSFEQIYRIFNNHLSSESLEDVLMDKQMIILDEWGLAQYSYANELSLADIETVAQFAQRAYIGNNNLEEYTRNYLDIIHLKESQLQYIYSNNAVAFQTLQNHLTNYLNDNLLFEADHIEQVRLLQDKYQYKLVFFDDLNKVWEPNNLGNSGFMAKYTSLDISQPVENTSQNEVPVIIDESLLTVDEDQTLLDTVDFEAVPLGDMRDQNLANIKNRLSRSKNNPTNVKDLPKPNLNPSLNMSESGQKGSQDETKQDGNISLPNTGEQQPLTLLALGTLLIGVVMLLVNLIIKRHQREKREDIELD